LPPRWPGGGTGTASLRAGKLPLLSAAGDGKALSGGGEHEQTPPNVPMLV
jgi:hypothetical protein